MRALESRAKRAALYIRISTQHQDYSIANQTAALERYAEDHKMFVVKQFLDSGQKRINSLRQTGP